MRQEPNNEIDLLLKRLSRGQGERVPETGSDHLDADELSSYAENALPAAARLRYTEHLAECARCRELVVQLSAATGVVVAEETAPVSAPAGLRKFLASLFSPMVLRYAVPAMGLLVVAVIGLKVFRQNDSFMAKRSAPERSVLTQEAEPQTPASGGLDQTQAKRDAAAATPQVHGYSGKQPKAGEETGAGAPVSTPIDEPKTVAEVPKVEKKEPAASEPAPPPAAKPSESVSELRRVEPQAQKETEQARIAAAKEVDQQQSKLQEGQRSGAGAAASDRPAKDKAKVATRGVFGTANERARRDSDDNYVDDGETRSVAGRQFRKQRGIWVDTAYNGGATVNLTRGSEQYRALVADEPDIKTIAEQLDGQIIVVWKSRTYRIR